MKNLSQQSCSSKTQISTVSTKKSNQLLILWKKNGRKKITFSPETWLKVSTYRQPLLSIFVPLIRANNDVWAVQTSYIAFHTWNNANHDKRIFAPPFTEEYSRSKKTKVSWWKTFVRNVSNCYYKFPPFFNLQLIKKKETDHHVTWIPDRYMYVPSNQILHQNIKIEKKNWRGFFMETWVIKFPQNIRFPDKFLILQLWRRWLQFYWNSGYL